jgi:hypothetical protein
MTRSDERADFLRLSRSSIDDTINQNLNALSRPSETNPFTSTQPGLRQPTRRLPPATCADFQDRVLFPSWQTRSNVLNYCAGVATSPDPEDPDHLLRESESAKARERIVNERLDPYGARNLPLEGRTEALANLVRRERRVEEIVRKRTWDLVSERCPPSGLPGEVSYEAALDAWRTRSEGSR